MQKHSEEPKSKVYFKRMDDWASEETISQNLLALWQKMDDKDFVKNGGFTAIKLTFGEEGSSGYIKPGWLSHIIGSLKQKSENTFIVETNTLYRERRSNAVGHLHVAHAHGYDIKSLGIPVIIADGLHGRDSHSISIHGDHFESVKIAKGICECDSLICLSHTTGHCQAGFAGAIKNLGMGCAARAGKLLQHSKTLPEVVSEKCVGCGACMAICPANAIGIKKKKAILVKERCVGCGECTIICKTGAIAIKYDESVSKFQEKMAEYALGVKVALRSNLACINLLYDITKNCDCMPNNEAPFTANIGLLAGFNPVAVDKASLDLIGVRKFSHIYPEIDSMHQIAHAVKVKLGSDQYELVEV